MDFTNNSGASHCEILSKEHRFYRSLRKSVFTMQEADNKQRARKICPNNSPQDGSSYKDILIQCKKLIGAFCTSYHVTGS